MDEAEKRSQNHKPEIHVIPTVFRDLDNSTTPIGDLSRNVAHHQSDEVSTLIDQREVIFKKGQPQVYGNIPVLSKTEAPMTELGSLFDDASIKPESHCSQYHVNTMDRESTSGQGREELGLIHDLMLLGMKRNSDLRSGINCEVVPVSYSSNHVEPLKQVVPSFSQSNGDTTRVTEADANTKIHENGEIGRCEANDDTPRRMRGEDNSLQNLEEKIVTIHLQIEASDASKHDRKALNVKKNGFNVPRASSAQSAAYPIKKSRNTKTPTQVLVSNTREPARESIDDYRVTQICNVIATGRRSAPVFSRRVHGTPGFWTSGQTILARNFRRSISTDSNTVVSDASISQGVNHRKREASASVPDVGASFSIEAGKSKAQGKKSSTRFLKNYGSLAPASSNIRERSMSASKLEQGSVQTSNAEYWSEYEERNRPENVFDIEPIEFRDGYTDGRSMLRERAGLRPPRGFSKAHNSRGLNIPAYDFGVDAGEAINVEIAPLTAGSLHTCVREEDSDENEDDSSSNSNDERDREEALGEKTPLLSSTSSSPEPITAVYKRRWYLLFLFSIFALIWNAIWSTWGPIAQSAKLVFDWTDGDIAMFTWLGNLPFLVTMFPIAYLMDVKGMRVAMVLCCGLTFLGAGLRCITSEPQWAKWLIYGGQLLNGIAGTVPISGPGLLSGLWFPPHQRATATAISTVLGYLGACVSFVIGPLLVPDPGANSPFNSSSISDVLTLDPNGSNVTDINAQRNGIMYILYAECAAAGLLFLLVIAYFPSRPPHPPSISASIPREKYVDGLKMLVRNKQFWVTAVAYSFPIGVYEVWQVVLDVNLHPRVSQQTAGWLDFYATLGGCVSGLLVSRFADLFSRQMKLFLLVFYFFSALSMLWFTLLVIDVLPFDIVSIYAAIIVGGVFLDGGAPLFFELVIEVSYPVGEGVTSGCLQMICAGAGVLFLSLLQVESLGKLWMNWMFFGCITLAIPLLFFINTTYGRADIDDMEIQVDDEDTEHKDRDKENRKESFHEKGDEKDAFIEQDNVGKYVLF